MKDLIVQVLGEVDLLFWLMNKQSTSSRHRHHVYLFLVNLWKTWETKNLHKSMSLTTIFSDFGGYTMSDITPTIPCLLRGRLRTHTQILWASICEIRECAVRLDTCFKFITDTGSLNQNLHGQLLIWVLFPRSLWSLGSSRRTSGLAERYHQTALKWNHYSFNCLTYLTQKRTFQIHKDRQLHWIHKRTAPFPF